MQLELDDKMVLVTGASRGIGKAIALVLASEGCRMVLVARSQPDLEALRSEILRTYPRATVHLESLDLRGRNAIDDLVIRHPEVEILINNAGAIPHGGLLDLSDDAWLDGWTLKVFGQIRMTRSYYGLMKQRGRGVIVNVIGYSGERMLASYVAGSSGNAALIAFTKAVGSVSAADGIRVVGVNPGPILTERLRMRLERRAAAELGNADDWPKLMLAMPFGRAGEPIEVADVVAFLSSPRAAYISGTIVTVDGGMTNRPIPT